MNLAKFKNPDAEFRIVPLWSWNDKLDAEELKRQIGEMAKKGWGGFFCHSRSGLVTGYLSDDWMGMINTCATEAEKTGTQVWLYDEDKWPSGYASGWLGEKEINRDRCLLILKKEDVCESDRVLKEFVHNSQDFAICMHVMPAVDEWFNGTTYGHMMNPDTVKEFLEITLEKYKKDCGSHFGKEIQGVFTDEPCYFMDNYYKGNRFYSMHALPWSEKLPEQFEKEKHYSLFDHIEELFINVNDYHKTRFDFFDIATRIFVESFTKQYGEWCGRNSLKLTGHFMGEDTMLLQTEFIGAAMPHYEHMQIPGVDKLSRNILNMVSIKQLTSAADQLGKERTFCETFGCMGQQSSFVERKWVADWEAVLGINFVGQHLSLYSMRGDRKRDYPPNFFIPQSWWGCEKPFADYIGRLSYAVAQGKRDVDILVLHPISSAWSEYTPFAEYSDNLEKIRRMDREFTALSEGLLAERLDFNFGDEIIMEQHAKVENGRLRVGEQSYSTVVVPASVTLRKNTFRLLCEFCAASPENLLIVTEPFPTRLDGACCEISWPQPVRAAASNDRIFEILNAKYVERISVTDARTGEKDKGVILLERTAQDGKTVFFANTDRAGRRDVSISIKSNLPPVAMDLTSGEFAGVPFKRNGEIIEIHAEFEPAGSMLLFFPRDPVEAKNAACLDSGVVFKSFETLESVECTSFTITEQNIFRLDKITLTLDGKKVLENELTAKSWYELYYRVADGTPFTADYAFEVRSIPDTELFAVIEMAENLDSIKLNGVSLRPLKPKGMPLRFNEAYNWKDLSFVKVPFSASLLRKGRNVLTIAGKKINNITGISTHTHVENFREYEPTELENIFIVGDFSVGDTERREFFLEKGKAPSNPRDITAAGYPFYAGCIDVKYEFVRGAGGGESFIKVEDVNAACLEAFVNGEKAPVKFCAPYLLDIGGLLHDGANTVEVKAYNTLFNLLGPNHIEDIMQRTGVGPYTFADYKKFTDKNVLLPFGIGPVSVLKPAEESTTHP